MEFNLPGIERIDFQEKAVKDMLFRVGEIFNRAERGYLKDEDRRMLLHATVGSGKTVMGVMLMEQVAKKYGDVAFVWLSPGEGGLHKQSEKSAGSIVEGLQVRDVQEILTQKRFNAGDVLFLNWESIRQEGNILRQEGEQTYLEECVKESEGVKIITIIDEAHRARNKSVINIFNPIIELDITATPSLKEYTQDNIIEVPVEDIVNAGIIKKEVHINVGIKENTPEVLLKEAKEKREKIETRFKQKTMNDLKPLVLIQLANDRKDAFDKDTKEEEEKVQEVKEQLNKLGVEDSKIGVWLSNQKENIEEDITKSDIEYLIFKQAVATGWDCPRSHILVRLRDVKTETFDIQTIGRIMRTVERKHYGDDLLDRAYILTEYPTVSYKPTPDFEGKILTEENKAELKPEFKEQFGLLRIPMRKVKPESDHIVDTQELQMAINKAFQDPKAVAELVGLGIDTDKIQDTFEVAKVDAKGILSGEIVANQSKKYLMTDYKVDKLFTFGVSSNFTTVDKYYIDENVKDTVLKNLLEKQEREREKEEETGKQKFITQVPAKATVLPRLVLKELELLLGKRYKTVNEVKQFYLSNRYEVDRVIRRALVEYKMYEMENIEYEVREGYSIKEEVYYKRPVEVDIDKYSHTKRPDLKVGSTKSKSEEPFAKWLDQQENVIYWFKNGTSKVDFSTIYQDAQTKKWREYYPDFIIITEDEGNKKLYIIDVKGPLDVGDVDVNVNRKYNAGKEYEEEYKGNMLDFNPLIDDIEFSMIKYKEDDKAKETPYICKATRVEDTETIDNMDYWDAFEI